MKITDKNFIGEISRRNEKALEYCMTRFGGLVKAVIRRHLGCLRQYEEECINDVFFAVWEHISSYDEKRNSFDNWIAGVARIKALDCRRRYARHLAELSWEEQEPQMHSREGQPEALVLQQEIAEEIQKLLECLKPQDRELFRKVYIEEQDLEEVSRNTGMSKPVIYNHLSRGKKKIRSIFANRASKGE